MGEIWGRYRREAGLLAEERGEHRAVEREADVHGGAVAEEVHDREQLQLLVPAELLHERLHEAAAQLVQVVARDGGDVVPLRRQLDERLAHGRREGLQLAVVSLVEHRLVQVKRNERSPGQQALRALAKLVLTSFVQWRLEVCRVRVAGRHGWL